MIVSSSRSVADFTEMKLLVRHISMSFDRSPNSAIRDLILDFKLLLIRNRTNIKCIILVA